jgi:uncharacterized phage protein (TIGR02218 family)
MRTPLWESSAGALATLLASGQPLQLADCYRLTLASGQILRWSGHDMALNINGELFQLGPGIERSKCKWSIGTEVDTLSLSLYLDVARPVLIGPTPLLAFASGGGLGGASLDLVRAFWGVNNTAPVGTLLWFKGRVSEIPEMDRDMLSLTIKSELERLNVKVPRQVYQAQCLATVYDAECGLSRPAFTSNGSLTGAATGARTQLATTLAQVVGFFDLGTLTFTSGACAGVARTVKSHTAGGGVSLLQPLPVQVAPGDSFVVVPGCDGLQSTCNGKFANGARFKGQPFIPQPESVL